MNSIASTDNLYKVGQDQKEICFTTLGGLYVCCEDPTFSVNGRDVMRP